MDKEDVVHASKELLLSHKRERNNAIHSKIEATRNYYTKWSQSDSSVQLLGRVWLFATPWTAAHQASLSFTISWSSLNSSPLSPWCHPTISSSVTCFSYCLQSFPASGSFPVSQLFASGDQNIWDSTSASVLPMNIQGLFPLRLTGLISLQSKRLSRVFSNITVQKYQLFSIQPFLSPSFHIRTWLLEKPSSSFPLNMTLEGLSRLPLFWF